MTQANDELINEIAYGLAKRAALVRSVPDSQLRKEAAEGPGFFGSALNLLKSHPTLPGMAAGAGLGGLAGYLRSDDKDKKRNAWTGALAGGALGGGLGAAAEFMPWDEKGRSISEMMAAARGTRESEGMFDMGPKVVPGAAGLGAGFAASGALEKSDIGTMNPRTVWRDPTRAGTEDVLKRGLQIDGRIGSEGVGTVQPEIAKALRETPGELERVVRELRTNESATVLLPAADKLTNLNKTLGTLQSSLDSLDRGIGDDVARRLGQHFRGKNVKVNQDTIRKAVQNEMVKVQTLMDEVKASGANVPIEITRTNMDDIMEAGFRSQMTGDPKASKSWARWMTEPFVEGVRKTTASDTPYLTRNWMQNKGRGWSLPGKGLGRRALSTAGPLGAAYAGYTGIKGLQDAVLGRGGSQHAADQAKEQLGF